MLDYERKKIAELELLYVQGDKEAPSICLLHGYGANAFDLLPFSKIIQPTNTLKLNWYFPKAPLAVNLGMGYQGRAWFPLNLEALQNFSSSKHYSEIEPEGMKKAREQLIAMLVELDLKPSQLILGGFSQGAMMTVDVCLHLKEALKAFILLSGTLVNSPQWNKKAKDHLKTKFFQSHGKADPVLQINGALKLYNLLKDANFEGSFFEFEGEHDIPQEVIIEVTNFLSKI